MTRSQDRAISRPPPRAKPSTTASEGTGRFSTPPYAARATGRCAIRSASVKLLRSLRSAPTQNALGLVLVTTTQRTRLVRGEVGAGGAEVAGHRGRHGVHRLGPVQGELGDVSAVAVPGDGDQWPAGRCCSCVSFVGGRLVVTVEGVPTATMPRRPACAARCSCHGVTGPMPRSVRRAQRGHLEPGEAGQRRGERVVDQHRPGPGHARSAGWPG